MNKKRSVFFLRLVNIPGAFAILIAYEFEMYRRQRKNQEVTLYSIELKNRLFWALPWVSFFLWFFFGLLFAYSINHTLF